MWTITRVVEFDLADPKWHVMPEAVVVEEEVEVEEPAAPAPSADLGDLDFDIDEWFQQNYSVEDVAAITAARFMVQGPFLFIPLSKHKIVHACAHQGKEIKEVDVTLTSRGHPEPKGKEGHPSPLPKTTHPPPPPTPPQHKIVHACAHQGKEMKEHKISHACAHQSKEMKEVDVTLTSRGHPESKGKKEMRVEVTIRTLHHGVVRVEDNEEHLFAAIDLVCDKVERKMQKLKEKARWTGSRARPKGALSEEEVEYREYKATEAIEGKEIEKQFSELAKEYPEMIRRTKVVETTPMSVSDAVDAIEAVGHDFYVFQESGGALRATISMSKRVKFDDSAFVARAWQEYILQKIRADADDRTIYWVTDAVGEAGKSRLAKHLVAEHKAIQLGGRHADMALIYRNSLAPVVIFDVSRSEKEFSHDVSMWTITRVVEFDLADPKWHVMPEAVVVEEEVEVEEPAAPAPSADLGDLDFDIDEWFQQNYSVEDVAAITAARFM
eukprot:gene26175-11902_t